MSSVATSALVTDSCTDTVCRRCGECCMAGGPALHTADLSLISAGIVPLTALITVRKGELVRKPGQQQPQPAAVELLKIIGQEKSWQCMYYQQAEQSCTIYQNRPLACRSLNCRSMDALLRLVEHDTLSRFDIFASDNPLRQVINHHEKQCPVPEMKSLLPAGRRVPAARREELQQQVNSDLCFRQQASRTFSLGLSQELLCFGRPTFQLLQGVGIGVRQTAAGLQLLWPD